MLTEPTLESGLPDLVDRLSAIVGAEHVLTDPGQLTFFSTDLFTHGAAAELVIQPDSAEALSRALAACAEAGRAVVPRGGGFSYTSGYIPAQDNTVIVDLRRLNRILEINVRDLYVTVECGCTWETLYQALKEKGVRTPFMGPASGFWSTIGGSLSQGGFFYGSTQYGSGADIALGLEVVLADGTIVTTGSDGSTHTQSPFLRNFGPDLTGLFLNDTGALGFKTKATLKLMPIPDHIRFATFPFDTMEPGLASLSEIARQGLAAETYLWDPVLAKSFAARNNLSDDLKYLSGVVRSGASMVSGLKDAAKMAMAGKRAFDGKAFLLHVVTEDVSEAGVEARMELVRAIVAANGGGETEPSAPRATRAVPFSNFAERQAAAPMVRNLPSHGLFPHSKVMAAAQDVFAMLESEKARMEALGVTYGGIFFAVGRNAVCVEPLMFWRDEQLGSHDRLHDVSNLDALKAFPERPPATQLVAEIRKRMIDLFVVHGGCFFQIGKEYPFRALQKPTTLALLDQIKSLIDPKRRVNPGSLGF
jgi:FAD/FMN-containing dehydrogenase